MSDRHLLELDLQSLHFSLQRLFFLLDKFFADVAWAWAEAEDTEAHIFDFFDAEVISDLSMLFALDMVSYEFMLSLQVGLFCLL